MLSWWVASCFHWESRYAPIEGEASAMAWSLDKCRMLVLGCQDLIVTTDHEPLKGIFGDRDHSKIANPRLFRLKERIPRYRFCIQHRQGKLHRGSDAMSRNPATAVRAVMQVCLSPASSSDLSNVECVKSYVRSSTVEAMAECGDDLGAISPDMIRAAGRADQLYIALSDTIEAGFPGKCNLLNPEIWEFWEVRDRLSTDDGLILMDNINVVPLSHRKRVLRCLHSAHQDIIGMKAQANVCLLAWNECFNSQFPCKLSDLFYHCPKFATWAYGDDSIPRLSFPADCHGCVWGPISSVPGLCWPIDWMAYDFSFEAWSCDLHGADLHLQAFFQTYGSPEELSSDGGSIFTSHAFQTFLET